MVVREDERLTMVTSIDPDLVMTILHEALQRPPEERDAYVRATCGGNHELYCEVADALQWEERMGRFLEEPLLEFTRLARPFEPGQLIGDRFEILREIGEGGMGVVYEAVDRKLQYLIAIKAAKPGFQRLLSPELKAALKVRHQNICLVKEIHTAHTDDGEIDFLAMEYLEGQTLSSYLAEVGKLQQEQALEIACQICAGLAEAHRSGIIHRDLKCGNIIICRTEDGSRRAVITDFGLAGGTAITSGEIAGTPAYMAPELWRGEPPSKASDVYALGVMLYEMVAGRRPYQASNGSDESGTSCPLLTVTEKQWQHRAYTDPPPLPPRGILKRLDPRWDRVIQRCLRTSPADRPEANKVLSELQRKRPSKALFVGPVLLILALAGVIGLIRPVRQRVIESLWPHHINPVKERQLTANPVEDRVTAAAISPDGRRVAYSDVKGLYLSSIESGESATLTAPQNIGERILWLRWFPDGDKLLAEVLGADGTELWIIGVTRVRDTRFLYKNASDPAISPNGKQIAFVSDYSVPSPRKMLVGDVSGGMPRELITDQAVFAPVWSPDGRWIAYARYRKTSQDSLSPAIEFLPASGGPAYTLVSASTFPQLGNMRFDTFTQIWSPDWRLVFSVMAGSQPLSAQTKYSLWGLRVSSSSGEVSAPQQLTPWSDFAPASLTTSSDGKRISFLKQRSWMDVYLGELEHGGMKMSSPWRLTLDNRGSFACGWTRNSQSILFVSDRTGKSDLYRQGVHEGQASKIFSEVDSCVDVSPDGAWLLYSTSEFQQGNGSTPIQPEWLMRRAIGGQPERVVPLTATDDFGCSSNLQSSAPCVLSRREGKELVFYSIAPSHGGLGNRLATVELRDANEFVEWNISPDASRVALLFVDKQDKRGDGIEVLTLADRSLHSIALEPGAGRLWSIAWAPDGKGFFVASKFPGSHRLLHVTFDGKISLLLPNMHRQFLYKVLPSFDGRYLAFNSKTFDSNVWMIDNF